MSGKDKKGREDGRGLNVVQSFVDFLYLTLLYSLHLTTFGVWANTEYTILLLLDLS